MTQYDLRQIIAEELARVIPGEAGKRRSRFDYVLPGFGERIHPSGRKSYVLQRTMGGKQRLITIGDAAILTERIAKDVARRLILRIELGENPADKKQRGRKTPTYAAFLQSYWEDADLCSVSAIILGSRRADLEAIHPRDPEHLPADPSRSCVFGKVHRRNQPCQCGSVACRAHTLSRSRCSQSCNGNPESHVRQGRGLGLLA